MGQDELIPPRTEAARVLAASVDHTLLDPFASRDDVERLCLEARVWGCASACVHSRWVALAADTLQPGSTVVCAVVGFPHGATLSSAKAAEARACVGLGAREIDMVLALGPLRHGEDRVVLEDIREVVDASGDAIVKVILEAGLLEPDELVRACTIARDAGASFVKTSTGFAGVGARVNDVRRMRDVVGEGVGVKASGGIHTAAQAQAMLDAGADRLGLSRTHAVLAGLGAWSRG